MSVIIKSSNRIKYDVIIRWKWVYKVLPLQGGGTLNWYKAYEDMIEIFHKKLIECYRKTENRNNSEELIDYDSIKLKKIKELILRHILKFMIMENLIPIK